MFNERGGLHASVFTVTCGEVLGSYNGVVRVAPLENFFMNWAGWGGGEVGC